MMAERQVVGGLMKNPLLLIDYNDISPMDFDEKIIRICFIAIKDL